MQILLAMAPVGAVSCAHSLSFFLCAPKLLYQNLRAVLAFKQQILGICSLDFLAALHDRVT